MNKQKKKKLTVFIIIFLIFAVVAAGFLLFQHNKFTQEQEVVDKVKQEVTEEPDSDSETDSGIDKYLLRKVDFDALWAINDDVKTWVFIPNTNIDSYVMQEQTLNKYKYSNRNIYGKYTTTGSLLIPKSPMDLEDAHTLILGHHMPGNSNAFGELVSYYGNESDNYTYMYLYYPDHSERWKLWLAADVKEDDMIYELPYEQGTEHYSELLEHLLSKSRYTVAETPDVYTDIVCLSTCNRWSSSVLGRFVVVWVPDVYYYYEPNDKYGGAQYVTYVDKRMFDLL